MLSVKFASDAILQIDPQQKFYDVFTFRTSKIVEIAHKNNINFANLNGFYYEMVIRRSNEKIRDLASDNKGFKMMLKLLRSSVDTLSNASREKGFPLSHQKVADFFNLELDSASDMLKKTEFELMYYPEWVNKVLTN